jgi:hypothetical protein
MTSTTILAALTTPITAFGACLTIGLALMLVAIGWYINRLVPGKTASTVSTDTFRMRLAEVHPYVVIGAQYPALVSRSGR